MRWARWYRIRFWVVTNMWMVPMLYAAAAIFLGWFVPHLDTVRPLRYGLNAGSMATALSSIATGMIAFTGLVFSIVLLIVQFGSGTFSTRLMRWFWRSAVTKHALGIFIATFLYSLLALADINSSRHPDPPTRSFIFAMLLVFLSVALFLALLARMTGLLRVARVTRELGQQTIKVIGTVAPYPYDAPSARGQEAIDRAGGTPTTVVAHHGTPASIMAIDQFGLVRQAQREGALIELVPAVGQHVTTGEPLFRVYGAPSVNGRALAKGVVFGEERTLDSDPAFGIRLMVDVALKALSPAINDPTTAVQVLDRLEDVLRFAGQRQLNHGVAADGQGRVRLVYPVPTWEDLVELALDEILVYGLRAPQVTRRMSALLERLDAGVPEGRRPVVARYLDRLYQAVGAVQPDPPGRRFALTPDPQGIGPRAHRGEMR